MFEGQLDATTALIILLSVCAVCLIVLLLIGRRFKKNRAPVEIPELYPIEHDIDEDDLVVLEQEEVYDIAPEIDVIGEYEARLTRIRAEQAYR